MLLTCSWTVFRLIPSAEATCFSLCPNSKRRSVCSRRRSEEHTSELQSPCNLVCRLLLEKKTRCLPRAAAAAPGARRPGDDLIPAASTRGLTPDQSIHHVRCPKPNASTLPVHSAVSLTLR